VGGTGLKIRAETFGGIIRLDDPPALVYVDQEYLRGLGYPPSPLWGQPEGYLSAPTEVHLGVTAACPLGCRHCYADARPGSFPTLDTESLMRVIDLLAEMQVFHIAFGGGEPFGRPDFLALARHARERDVIPNATTNGLYMTPELARECGVFGQINVSVDGVGPVYEQVRGVDGFAMADRALGLLVEAGCSVGVNCVVSRANFERLGELVSYVASKEVRDVLFLRLKPSGRGAMTYQAERLTPRQNRQLFPLLADLTGRHDVLLRMDCSFVPMVCWHGAEPATMEFFDVRGCAAGESLAGITPEGRVQACSFCGRSLGEVWRLRELWHDSPRLRDFRGWVGQAREPCRSCTYLSLCRGGCHTVAEWVEGDFWAPDPECPFVEAAGRA